MLESLDNGKPIRESRDIDIPLVVRHFYHHAGWAQLMPTALAAYQPVGVVGQIIPWNFPLLMLAWKIAPALAMGNTVVLKPAPYTPLTALLFAEVVAEAGLPPGVVNIVTGGDETGALVVAHPDIDKIAFTGSTEVGRILRRVTAGTGKRLSLELGGKSPYVVFDDADQDAAVEGLVDAIWFNQGQVCCAGSRLLVQENIADRFLDKVRRRMAHLRTGDALDKTIDLGAVVDPVQYEIIDRWVKIGVAGGRGDFPTRYADAERGLFLSAHAVNQRVTRLNGGSRRDLRAGARRHDLSHARRSHRTGQQYPLRAGGQYLEREYQPRPGSRPPDQGRERLGELHEPV